MLSCCYEPVFETPFLEASAKHFSDLANLFLKKHDCYTFLSEVEQTLTKEQQLANDFVKPQTERKLMQLAHDILITQ